MGDSKNSVTGISNWADVKGLTRDRPWLLASNRKLRHLQGISLRNLTLVRSPAKNRRKTNDDQSLPTSLKSPIKIQAQLENHKLELSRSSDDLKAQLEKKGATKAQDSDSDVPANMCPSSAKFRRRSTLNWTNAPPRIRQQKLEEVAAEKMADTWFSVHCDGIDDPIYVSETIENAMNPSFRFFDLNIYGPLVTRQDELTIKYWAQTEKMEEFLLLIELRVNLRSLQFIGKTLESFHHPLPPNCILLHLSDGIYTSFTDLPLDEPIVRMSKISKGHQSFQSTSSFDALMQLSNLDDCIQDALSTREKLASQINSLLEEQKQARESVSSTSQAEEGLASTTRSLGHCRKQLKAAQSRRSDLQRSLDARRAAISRGKLAQEKSEDYLDSIRSEISSRRLTLREGKEHLSGQIRRIGEDLSRIYPIDPIEPGSLSFTVRGLHLPNAGSPQAASDVDPATTAAALGMAAHATYLLSLYLSSPLPYPPTPHGSTSTIYDPISTSMPSQAARTFPLYQKGAVAYRFEYGVFLLNSDIELLTSRQGSRMADLRHTLPNLKYILTVLTAGEGELPVRKKGVVQALKDTNGKAVEGPTLEQNILSVEKAMKPKARQALHETRKALQNA